MTAPSPLRHGAAGRLAFIDAVLEAAYGTPEGELDNKAARLDEAIYIILSLQTDLPRFRSTWSTQRAAYPSCDALARAAARDVARVLRDGDHHRQKTRPIYHHLAELRKAAGEHSLDLLRGMNNEAAERLLTRLPR